MNAAKNRIFDSNIAQASYRTYSFYFMNHLYRADKITMD
ncbi:hypothetical protein BOVAB4_2071 [Bacteroides ovatus]|nr:hypothetical protein BOVA115_2302 [Bacteroides ovatus]CAG9896528.1 hypothetical protein BOVA514_3722 [Bacteroides ovatus]CAG9911678.1 hypothetical protein BOVAB4_2071 [Bacteroides ovatus]